MRLTHARLHHLGQGSMHATGYSPTHRTHRALIAERERRGSDLGGMCRGDLYGLVADVA
jgi:hypothetical protein